MGQDATVTVTQGVSFFKDELCLETTCLKQTASGKGREGKDRSRDEAVWAARVRTTMRMR